MGITGHQAGYMVKEKWFFWGTKASGTPAQFVPGPQGPDGISLLLTDSPSSPAPACNCSGRGAGWAGDPCFLTSAVRSTRSHSH